MTDPPVPDPLRIAADIETSLSPEGVVDSLVDFSERRLKRWPSLDPTKFHVQELGDAWAIVREGSAEPDISALERYEWTDSLVTATVIESDFCLPGDFLEYRVEPDRDGGSVVHVTWSRRPRSPEYEPLFEAMRREGATMLRQHLGSIWDGLAEGG